MQVIYYRARDGSEELGLEARTVSKSPTCFHDLSCLLVPRVKMGAERKGSQQQVVSYRAGDETGRLYLKKREDGGLKIFNLFPGLLASLTSHAGFPKTP